ncbi:MAG: DUF1800 family protein [Rhodoferax sp.]|nr:DUF1800 family protein [Rhodoferax sp.]
MKVPHLARSSLLMAVTAIVLGACAPAPEELPAASSGQVKPVAAGKMSAYAAARAADQVSFGATPALVAELQQIGLEAWIDQQLALPPSIINNVPRYVVDYVRNVPEAESKARRFAPDSFYTLAMVGPDQLRLRVNWAMQQFVPVNSDAYPIVEYFNMFQRNALGNYGTFLRELSVDPAMGAFLGNNQNRPRSNQCPDCAPNENWARELMQLFSIGVVQLNADGTTKRDAKGKALETYTQKDVEELARAFTGWRFAQTNPPPPDTNGHNAPNPMEPDPWEFARDSGAKIVMGTSFTAGQSARQDLETAVSMLVAHPNIAPFVSLRLIQHLVASNPSPQYLGRVAGVFRNNGQGVVGDMKATVKAVLLDPEARRGDVPGTDRAGFGKLREPVLFITAAMRGLGCRTALKWTDGGSFGVNGQSPLQPPSVFSFYLPTDRAPGSNLLAPEQKLATTNELSARLRYLEWTLVDNNQNGGNPNSGSGCDVASLGRAFAHSPKALIDLISARWFRGAMPPSLRSNLMALAATQTVDIRGAVQLLEFALTTPYFGVIK